MSSASPIIRCESLLRLYDTVSGRVQAVRGVDLEVDAGVVAAIVGPSGCGKSSLLRMVSGIDPPTAGRVLIDGIDLYQLREARRARVRGRLLTHVHQRPADNLFAHLTARHHLERLERRRDTATIRTTEALEHLGLTALSDSVPHEMSGGEQQRLAFAAALVAGHRVVIADEPTSQLDSDSATAVLEAVERLAHSGVTVLLATHDPRVLERVGHIVALRDGAVSSVSSAGEQWAVIDRSGRVQLPAEMLDRFPGRRAKLVWNTTDDIAEVRPQ